MLDILKYYLKIMRIPKDVMRSMSLVFVITTFILGSIFKSFKY
jgi:hypothetical protein